MGPRSGITRSVVANVQRFVDTAWFGMCDAGGFWSTYMYAVHVRGARTGARDMDCFCLCCAVKLNTIAHVFKSKPREGREGVHATWWLPGPRVRKQRAATGENSMQAV